mgnify:CR=1 FL=1
MRGEWRTRGEGTGGSSTKRSWTEGGQAPAEPVPSFQRVLVRENSLDLTLGRARGTLPFHLRASLSSALWATNTGTVFLNNHSPTFTNSLTLNSNSTLSLDLSNDPSVDFLAAERVQLSPTSAIRISDYARQALAAGPKATVVGNEPCDPADRVARKVLDWWVCRRD